MWRNTGRLPPELDLPELPACVEGLWRAFLTLNAARGSSGFGPAPLTFGALRDYGAVMGCEFSVWEAETVMELDRVALAALAAKD